MTEKENNNLVFFAIGERYNKECLYAIMTLLNVYENDIPESLHINVYTDMPGFFSPLFTRMKINLVLVNNETIVDWISGTNYFFRTKICLIKSFLENHKGNMIYVDTDVLFQNKLEDTFKNISVGKLILHIFEAKLSSKDAFFVNYLNTYKNREYKLSSNRTILVDENSEMWNAGLIGISSKHISIIDEVLELCDQLTQHSSFRTLEQFAFSLVFQDTKKLVGAQEVLIHYWWNKKLLNKVIDNVFLELDNNFEKKLKFIKDYDPFNPHRRNGIKYHLIEIIQKLKNICKFLRY